jgi:hypothetical protein
MEKKPRFTRQQRAVWNKLLEWLDTPAKRKDTRQFNMNQWFRVNSGLDKLPVHECGTTCCIGGYVNLLVAPKNNVVVHSAFGPRNIRSEITAQEALGIDRPTASSLFYPGGFHYLLDIDWEAITKKQAAKVVRHFLETGTVDWNVPFKYRIKKATAEQRRLNPKYDSLPTHSFEF